MPVALPVLVLFACLAALLVLPLGARAGEAVPPDVPLERVLLDPPATGLVLLTVAEGSQAAAAGLELGDVVVSYDGTPTPTLEALGAAKAAAEEAKKDRVVLEVVRADGKTLEVSIAPGPIGVNGAPVEKGRAAPPLPPATDVSFDFAALAKAPHDDWYAFHLGPDGKKGFEHARVFLEDGKVVMRREVAFDGGEAWGLNHFDVTVRMTAEPTPRLVDVRFENPLTGFVGTGVVKAAEDGERVLRYAWRVQDGEASGERAVVLPDDLPSIPSYFIETLAAFMPRQKGACLHLRAVIDGWGTLEPRSALLCAGEEELHVGGATVKTWRFEQHRLGGGARVGAYWVDADGRVVRSDYGGPVGERASRAEALEGLHPELKPRSDD